MNSKIEEESSGEPNAGLVIWHDWGSQAFELARQRNQPVILSIGAVWCYWCGVMQDTTFSDPDVVAFVNSNFVCVRVDNDHRPDINSRYNVGGWPTTAFLTGHGGIVAGATYLPPDQFIAMLIEVQKAYQGQKPDLYQQANNLFRQRQDRVARIKASGDLDPLEIQRIVRKTAGIYDPINGGFGEEPKFPSCSVIRLVLDSYRTTGEAFYGIIAEKTLTQMAAGSLRDSIDGGFFRFCNFDNWTEAQHEKMLDDNIGLAGIYMDAWMLLEDESYKAVANETLDYIIHNLYAPDYKGFRGSQGAHSEYYNLGRQERIDQPTPSIDPSCYVDRSAQAASLLFKAYWVMGRLELLEIARLVLTNLVSKLRANDLFHVFGVIESQPLVLLSDWASFLNALMDAHNWDIPNRGSLEIAVEVAEILIDLFYDQENGGFFDIVNDDQAVGYLKLREKPLPENLIVIEGMLKLYNATSNDRYHTIMNNTLKAYISTYGDYGEYAAAYGLLQERFLSPEVEITIEGNTTDKSTFELLKGAFQLQTAHLLIRPVLNEDHQGGAEASICLSSVCMPPVQDVQGLRDQISSIESNLQLCQGQISQDRRFEHFQL